MQAPARRAVLAAVAGLALLILAVLADAHLGGRGVRVHLVVETGAVLALTAAAFLFTWRAGAEPAEWQVLVIAGLIVLCLLNLVGSLLPAVAGWHEATAATWPGLLGRVAAAMLLVGGALHRRPDRRMRRPVAALAIVALATTILLATTWLLADPAIGHADTSEASAALALAFAAAYALAGARYAVRAVTQGDPLVAGLGGGVFVLGVSWLDVALLPQVREDAIHGPDVVRMLAFGLMLAGGAAEVRRWHRAVVLAAGQGERVRLARDLHDGVTQDVTLMASLGRKLAREVDSGEARMLAEASQHALLYLRGELRLLSYDPGRPLAALLDDTLGLATASAGLDVAVDAPGEVALDPSGLEALLGIVREAAANAARHAGARHLRVTLHERHDGLLLEIADDGRGFVRGAEAPGYGLRTMTERAAAAGGHVTIDSVPGQGTVVYGWLPPSTRRPDAQDER